MLSVDINCDLGEGTGADDLALLDIVTSANIACGGHAGDEASMDATVAAAQVRGVAIGAHPGYPDRANFGRVALDLAASAIEAAVFEQCSALAHVTQKHGGRLSHVKLHGALYHRAMIDETVARAVGVAVDRLDRSLLMVAMPRTVAHGVWQRLGFTVVTELFADRVYEPDGTLRSRALPGALITDPAAAAAQAVDLAQRTGSAGTPGLMTLCIHSDTPNAVRVARGVRDTLERNAFAVVAPPRASRNPS